MYPGQKIRCIITTVLPFVWFVLLDICYRYLYPMPGLSDWTNKTALVFTLCWGGIISGLLALLPVVLRRIFTLLISVVVCIVLLLHAIFYNLNGIVFSFSDIIFAGDGFKFLSFSYFHVRFGLIIVFATTFAGAIITSLWIPKQAYRWPRAVAASVILIICAFGIFQKDSALRESNTTNITWDNAVYDTEDEKSVYTNFSDPNRIFYMTGSYQYLFRNILITTGLENRLENGITYAVLDQYYANRYVHQTNDWSGVFAGKNLILIQLESIDTWMLTPEYMPNLYRLQSNGVNFNNHFTPLFSAAATFNTEFIVNTGFLIPPNGVSNKAYISYPMPYSLPQIFRNAGYSANSFHSSVGKIYNREEIHQNWGYESYNSYVDMNMDDYMRDSQMINGYSKMVKNTPFLTFIITYSGHGPYDKTMDNISEGHWDDVRNTIDYSSIPATGEDLEEYERAIAHAMETDAFIGALVERLTEDGHIHDTVLFFYDDHYSKYMTNSQLVMELKGAANYNEMMRTPCFFYFADMKPVVVEKATSSIDLLPTIANLFDLRTEYRYYPGQDVFGGSDGLVMFQNYDWYDGEIMHTADEDEESSAEQIITAQVHEILDRAWSTFRSNYFEHIMQQGDGT